MENNYHKINNVLQDAQCHSTCFGFNVSYNGLLHYTKSNGVRPVEYVDDGLIYPGGLGPRRMKTLILPTGYCEQPLG